jgi:hypothetical protein
VDKVSKNLNKTKYPKELKEEVKRRLMKGEGVTALAKEYQVPFGTLMTWRIRERKKGNPPTTPSGALDLDVAIKQWTTILQSASIAKALMKDNTQLRNRVAAQADLIKIMQSESSKKIEQAQQFLLAQQNGFNKEQ